MHMQVTRTLYAPTGIAAAGEAAADVPKRREMMAAWMLLLRQQAKRAAQGRQTQLSRVRAVCTCKHL